MGERWSVVSDRKPGFVHGQPAFRQIPYLRIMFLYNITVVVEDDIQAAVRAKIEEQIKSYPSPHIRLLELVNSPHEGTTYCIHLSAANQADIQQFQELYLTYLQQLASQEYAGKLLFFDSTLKYLAAPSK